ncbi:hypothetical protein DLAC_06547 [Tieghemostelium lacteum]|uniref:Uncharacterized protein n=1 Tax=Tieghemostelium lacteum TaxID=361077 RepID=A0A151ZF17_TIELA|nr:hypothetical protein DLAC_06547 [Tieghemostelium lacteum]|eukprot:KYQ92556.1 hypothetical protein DLAC_06547 [Tieghemostelium lacteum]
MIFQNTIIFKIIKYLLSCEYVPNKFIICNLGLLSKTIRTFVERNHQIEFSIRNDMNDEESVNERKHLLNPYCLFRRSRHMKLITKDMSKLYEMFKDVEDLHLEYPHEFHPKQFRLSSSVFPNLRYLTIGSLGGFDEPLYNCTLPSLVKFSVFIICASQLPLTSMILSSSEPTLRHLCLNFSAYKYRHSESERYTSEFTTFMSSYAKNSLESLKLTRKFSKKNNLLESILQNQTKSLVKLDILTFSNEIFDSTLDFCMASTALKVLKLKISKPNLLKKLVKSLNSQPNIQKLELNYLGDIRDKDVLQPFTHLKSLYVSIDENPNAIPTFLNANISNTTITSLSIRNDMIATDAGSLQSLTEFLKKNTSIVKFRFVFNSLLISPETSLEISKLLSQHPTIRELIIEIPNGLKYHSPNQFNQDDTLIFKELYNSKSIQNLIIIDYRLSMYTSNKTEAHPTHPFSHTKTKNYESFYYDKYKYQYETQPVKTTKIYNNNTSTNISNNNINNNSSDTFKYQYEPQPINPNSIGANIKSLISRLFK